MYCPQCGHQQVSDDTRYCSHCGLSLGLATDLLATSSEQLRREKHELRGFGLVMATVLMLMNFVIVFGTVALPHLANPVFLWIWAAFVISSLIVGGLAFTNLIRGGFFKRVKEREARLSLLKSKQEQQLLPEESGGGTFDPALMARAGYQASVTETTTRELRSLSKPTNEISRDRNP